MKTVHCLDRGVSLCGMAGVPGDWQAGNVWISRADWPRGDAARREISEKGSKLCETCDDEVTRDDT